MLWLPVFAPLLFLSVEVATWVRNIPRWDEFDTVLELLIALDSGAGGREVLSRLFAVQNEHRMLVSRLLFAGSYWLSGSVNFAVLAVIGNLFLVGTFVVLVARTAGAWARWRMAFIFACVVFQLQHHENLFWGGASIDHLFVVLASIAALAALTRPGRGWVALGCVSGFLGSFSLAHGLVVWPIGAVLLLLQRRRAAAAAWAGVTALTVALFLSGFRVNPAHRMPGWADVSGILEYWLTIVGSSAALDDVRLAPWLGALLVTATIGLFYRGGAPRERLAGATLCWCLGAMALVAYGRALIAAEWAPVTSRYVILSSIAWAMLVWVVVERALSAARHSVIADSNRGRALRTAVAWGLPGLAAALVAFNLAASLSHRTDGRVLARASETAVHSYHQHGTFAHAVHPLYPDPQRADALVAEAQRRGLYRLPAAAALQLAHPRPIELEQPVEIADAVYFIEEVGGDTRQMTVRGWAFRPDHTTRLGELAVVFRSERGLFVFEAMPLLRPDVAEEFERWDASYAGFELRLPRSQLPPGKFNIGVCFAPRGDSEFMMTGSTVEVPPGEALAQGGG